MDGISRLLRSKQKQKTTIPILNRMANWHNNYYDKCVTREGNLINILKLDRARAVSDLIRALGQAIKKYDYQSLSVDFSEVDACFPNAIVPFAGIFEYYQNKGITFDFINLPQKLETSQLISPQIFDGDSRHILSRVWKFSSSEEVCNIVDAYISELQKSAQFYKGVLDSIEWSLNEVMDNVIQHSKIGFGYVMGQLHSTSKNIAFTVFDAGQGIYNSLKDSVHKPRTTVDAISLAIQEEITRDKSIGQGNGLFGLSSIVKQGHGKLVITSGRGSYSYNNVDTRTYDNLPAISHETPGTIVDFQLSYAKDMSLDKALVFRGKQYDFASIHFEEYEDDYGRLVYSIKDMAEGTGTRDSAFRVKNEVLNILEENKRPITLDFEGTSIISSSFADELLAKLFLELGLFQFNNLIKIKGLDMSMQKVLQRSVLQRIIEDFHEPSKSN